MAPRSQCPRSPCLQQPTRAPRSRFNKPTTDDSASTSGSSNPFCQRASRSSHTQQNQITPRAIRRRCIDVSQHEPDAATSHMGAPATCSESARTPKQSNHHIKARNLGKDFVPRAFVTAPAQTGCIVQYVRAKLANVGGGGGEELRLCCGNVLDEQTQNYYAPGLLQSQRTNTLRHAHLRS